MNFCLHRVLHRVNSQSHIAMPGSKWWRETPFAELPTRARTSIWVEPPTFHMSAGRLTLMKRIGSAGIRTSGERPCDYKFCTLTTRPRRPPCRLVELIKDAIKIHKL